MSQQINDSFENNSPKPLDSRYHKSFILGRSIPYSSTAEVNSTIPIDYRYQGMTVLIKVGGSNVEYWYKDGVTDSDLMEKMIRLQQGNNITITQTGNIDTISSSGTGGGGDGSSEEIFTVTGNFSKTFSSGTIIDAFLLVPADNNSYTISVGTTNGGGEIFNSYPLDGSNPQFFQNLKYFKSTQTWYFTGIPSGTMVVILYRPQIILT